MVRKVEPKKKSLKSDAAAAGDVGIFFFFGGVYPFLFHLRNWLSQSILCLSTLLLLWGILGLVERGPNWVRPVVKIVEGLYSFWNSRIWNWESRATVLICPINPVEYSEIFTLE